MSKPLPSKEQGLFRQVVQNYENKQYKKGLKVADQILKKHPEHGDTIAMKALIIGNQGKMDEAFELAKQALKYAMKSQVCWHVYGMLYRSAKNYEEAAKAYKFAQRLDPESQQIQRDLALLLVQMRDYPGFVQIRKTMLQQRPGIRQNWTAMAIAHHLAGEHEAAENILTTFEGTLKHTPPRTDQEHAGAVLYKNTIIAESGNTERALEHLDTIYKTHPDRMAVMGLKAKYLLKLGRKEEAEKAYRKLLGRNLNNRAYYEGLEAALGLERSNAEDRSKLRDLYKSYSEKSERIDAPRRIPLDFLDGDDFREAADAYLRRMLRKGVPSTFANVKSLYGNDEKKHTIQELVLGYESEQSTNGSADHQANGTKPDLWKISVFYFLAQHYNYHLSRDLDKAHSYIDQCISLNTSDTEYSYHMTKARIYKHQKDTRKASETMNEARLRDLRDRYINTKCAKYQLRDNQTSEALTTMGLFTRKEAVGGALGDLLDMQCMWFLYESGRAHERLGDKALALKRYKSIHDVFETWTEDQFDFHSFSLRKGQIAAYVDMLRWEDTLRSHPFYTRAALSAVGILVALHDDAAEGKGDAAKANGESEADKKKAAKKARKDAERAEEAKKAAAAAASNPTADEEKKKEDTDPTGAEAYKLVLKDPLAEAMKYISSVLDLAIEDGEVQIAAAEVFIRRKKYLPAVKSLVAAQKAGVAPERVKALKERLEKDVKANGDAVPEKAVDVLKEGLASLKV